MAWTTSRFGLAAFSRIVYCGILVWIGVGPQAADQNATVSSTTSAGTSMLIVFSRFRVTAEPYPTMALSAIVAVVQVRHGRWLRQPVDHEGAVADDRLQRLLRSGQQREVGERVAVDHDQVGQRAGLDHADLPGGSTRSWPALLVPHVRTSAGERPSIAA